MFLFARFIYQASQGDEPAAVAAAFASRATRQGHICLDLREELEEIGDISLFFQDISTPDQWLAHLEKSRAFAADNRPAPLKKDDKGRIYLFRYWEYQQNLARRIKKLGRNAHARPGIGKKPAGFWPDCFPGPMKPQWTGR